MQTHLKLNSRERRCIMHDLDYICLIGEIIHRNGTRLRVTHFQAKSVLQIRNTDLEMSDIVFEQKHVVEPLI